MLFVIVFPEHSIVFLEETITEYVFKYGVGKIERAAFCVTVSKSVLLKNSVLEVFAPKRIVFVPKKFSEGNQYTVRYDPFTVTINAMYTYSPFRMALCLLYNASGMNLTSLFSTKSIELESTLSILFSMSVFRVL